MIKELFFTNGMTLIPFLLFLLLIDNQITKKRGDAQFYHAIIRISFYFGLAFLFGCGVFYYHGYEKASLFVAGYILEYSLSIDNLFLFLIIIKFFDVKKHSDIILSYGIMLTILLRLFFVYVGAVAVQKFHYTLFIFGIFLIYGAVKMIAAKDHKHDSESIKDNFLFKVLSKMITIDYASNEKRMFIKKNGKIYGTRLFIAMVFVVLSDLMCAIDSIPAIFGITSDLFIIYTSNVFAILGLRSAYILLVPMVGRFGYLENGLIIILAFIGIKLCVNTFFPELISVKITISLVFIVIIGSILLSILNTKKKNTAN